MHLLHSSRHGRWLCGAAALALAAASGAGAEERARFDIPPQPLSRALAQFGVQSRLGVIADSALTRSKTSRGVAGPADPDAALARMLEGTGLTFRHAGDAVMIVRTAQARPEIQRVATMGAVTVADAAAEGAAPPETNVVQELVVTAQKREEAIQTVPIAISAFTQKTLEAQHIEGEFDLLKAIPNVTFSKNNFSGYNFSIRGIGTKAISVTTDPGVAVEFNGTALIRNRLFEQEYFDVERVEVLRGPQGTLHGRNATAGVINVISAKPTDQFEGSIKAEVGNYQSRRASGFINIPVFGDKLEVRVAGSATMRDGYDYNATTKHPVNGRDLWSGRLTIGFKPMERLHGNLVWEHFDENDDRSRTGKQLCHRDPGRTSVNGEALTPAYGQAETSQGCLPGSLYDDGAYGTPNGLSIPFIYLGGFIGDPGGQIGYTQPYSTIDHSNAADEDSHTMTALLHADPYGGMKQSRDLRVINSFRDPRYRAKTDVVELNFDVDVTPSLTFTSQTAYDRDQVYSFQDYNRFNTLPVFPDTSGLFDNCGFGAAGDDCHDDKPSRFRSLSPGGVYCDPQLGCSNTIAGFDISQAKSTQVSQEFRLSSSFQGRFNFSAGVNYTHYKTLEDYYVMYNIITLLAQLPGGMLFPIFNNSPDITKCGQVGVFGQAIDPPVDINSPEAVGCIYIDPNPVESINGEGHNYFRSKNPYKLTSLAAFGETYFQATETLKVTAGLRYTEDRKTFTPVPTQILLSSRAFLGGTVDRGYPADPDIKQHWGEFTGRLGVDWSPKLSFTDQTMVYAFYSRGYKGGGANPPGVGFTKADLTPGHPLVTSISYPKTFDPEFVNAFELGTKNMLLGGGLVLNGDVFFYDYKGYQVSQIKERTAVNENFDATVWGLELESIWQPARNLRFNASLGYQDTKIGDGMKSLDLMDRTAGNPDYAVLKPFIVQPSNCIVPKAVIANAIRVQREAGQQNPEAILIGLCPGNWISEVLVPAFFSGLFDGSGITREQWLAETNHGVGFAKELGGNKLPNAPHWTVSLGGQQSWDFLEGWRATLRADAYWQSQSWARVYNDDPYDKLHGWYNANLSLWFEKPDIGLKIEFYAKNLLNKTPITDAFLNSDDTALTTNVFVLDPRLIGFSVTKKF